MGGSKVTLWTVSPCIIHWMHWSNGSWQTPCRCLDQHSYWCHSSRKCQHRWFSHSWPGATWNIQVFLTDVLSGELAAYPFSMFSPDGSMQISTNKACLKNNLGIETIVSYGDSPLLVADVSAALWTLPCPPHMVVQTLINTLEDLGCKQTQQFRWPSGTGQVFWLLYQE